MKIYVVTQPELGWDNIVAMYPAFFITYEELCSKYPESDFIIIEKTLHRGTDNEDADCE